MNGELPQNFYLEPHTNRLMTNWQESRMKPPFLIVLLAVAMLLGFSFIFFVL